MKKIIILTLISTLLVFSAYAGGSKEEAKPGTPAKAVELEFPSWQAEEAGFAEFWKELIPEFEKQNPGAIVKLSQIPFKDYNDTLTTRFAAGNPPSILHLPARNVAQYAAQGWLDPLDERFKGTDILAKWTPLQKSMEFNGKNMGLLLMGYGFILYYNEKMLSEAGVPVPKTAEELLEAAKKLTNENAGIFGMGLTTAEHPNIYVDISNVVYGKQLSFFKDGKYVFTDPHVVKAVDIYRDLSKYSPKGTTTELKRQLFVDGKLAMTIDGPWVAAMLPKASDAVRPHLKLAHAPFVINPGNPSNSIHLPSKISDDKKGLVWNFIKLIASPEFQARYTILTKSPAGRAGVLTPDMIKQNPALEIINSAAAKAVNSWPESQNVMANYAQYSKLVSTAMMKLMLTNEPTLKVLEDLQNRLNGEIKP
jgi:multiple sugar transport system substrate-binding protein